MGGCLATTRQRELAGVSRATIYAHQKSKVADEDDLMLSRLIDEEYTRHPYYGTRRMVVIISALVGFAVNRKRIQRLMQAMGLQGMAPGPNTSRAHPQHPVYPYLLRGLEIIRPNQV
jgi:putative transposase